MLRASGALIQFVFNVFLARLLGANGLGLYSLALIISTLSSCMARWGIDQAMIKICAVKAQEGQWQGVRIALVKGCQFVLLIGSLMSLAFWFAAPTLADKVFDDLALTFPIRIMSLSIAPFSLLNVIAESLRGLKKIIHSTFLQAVCVPLFSCILFGISVLSRVTISAALFAYLLATVITLLIGLSVWNKTVPSENEVDGHGDVSIREILVLSVPMGWATVMVMIMGMADSIILGIFATSEEIGIYSAALRLSMLVTISLLAVNSIAAPKIATLYKLNALRDLEKLSQRANVMMVIIASPLLVLYFVLPSTIMSIFGIEFRQGGSILTILAIGQVITMMLGSVGTLLLMTEYEKVMKWINVAAATSNIGLSFILVPIWGAIGAAWANTTSLIILNVLALIMVWKLLQLSPIPFLSRIQPN